LGGARLALLLALLLLPAAYPLGVGEEVGVELCLFFAGAPGTSADYIMMCVFLPGERVVINESVVGEYTPGTGPPSVLSVTAHGVESIRVAGVGGVAQLSVSGEWGEVVLEGFSARSVSVMGSGLLEARNLTVECGSLVFSAEHAVLVGLDSGGCESDLVGVVSRGAVVEGLSGLWSATINSISVVEPVGFYGRVEVSDSNFSELKVYSREVIVRGVSVGVVGGYNRSSSPGVAELVARDRVVVESSSFFVESVALGGSEVIVESSRFTVLDVGFGVAKDVLRLVDSSFYLSAAWLRVARNVSVEGCVFALDDPVRVHMLEGEAALHVSGSSFSCRDGCLALALHGTRLNATIADSVFTGSGPALSVVAYPPDAGTATVRVRASYFQDPAGPSVVVSGRTLRAGGMAIVLAGQATGGVVVESWLAAPGGPLLEPAPGAPFGYSVPGALQALLALARGGAPSEYALVAKYPGVEEEPRVRLRGAAIVAAYADGVPVEPVEEARGEYLIPRPAETLLLYLAPAPEPPAETTTTQAPAEATTPAAEAPTASGEPAREEEGRGLAPLLAGAAAAAAALAWAWARRR